MNAFFVMGLGAYIVAAAQYVRDGSDGFYLVWIIGAVGATVLGQFVQQFRKKP